MPDGPALDPGPAPRRSLRIATVGGVPVELAPSWFAFAVVVVVAYGPLLGGPRGALLAAGFAVLLLVSVLLHEAGHAVAARLLRLRVRRVTVSFLAGTTEVVDPPPTPGSACAVSIAGPLVSVVLTGLAGLAAVAGPAAAVGSDARALLVLTAVSNGGIAVFNLLPGLPLDGGGVLRALVWRITGDAARGTVVGAQAGRVLALVVVPLAVLVVAPAAGLTVSPVGIVTSALVASFLYLSATAALRGARVEQSLSGLAAAGLARPALPVLADLPLSDALRLAHEADLHAIVVVDATGQPRAVVSEAAVLAVPRHRRPWVAVGDLARPLADGLVLSPELTGELLVEAVRRTPASEYVVRGPQPRVLVTADLEARLRPGASGRPAHAVA